MELFPIMIALLTSQILCLIISIVAGARGKHQLSTFFFGANIALMCVILTATVVTA